MTPRAQATKEKANTSDFIKIKTFVLQRTPLTKRKDTLSLGLSPSQINIF